jgi:hypothetical protein
MEITARVFIGVFFAINSYADRTPRRLWRERPPPIYGYGQFRRSPVAAAGAGFHHI